MINEITKDYLENLRLLGDNKEDILYAFRMEARENNIPIITDDVERLIKIIIKAVNAKNILEVGAAVGYSSCVFVNAMGENSKVKTIERDETRYKEAVINIKKYGYDKNIEILNEDATLVLENEKDMYDIVFLDGNKGHYIHMLKDCKRVLKKGGLLICDNVLFRGMIDKSTPLIRRKITIVKRLRMFLEAISSDKELTTSVLPIGDGLSISIKK